MHRPRCTTLSSVRPWCTQSDVRVPLFLTATLEAVWGVFKWVASIITILVSRACAAWFRHDGDKHFHAAPSLPAVVEGLRLTTVTWCVLPHQPIALNVDYTTQYLPIINPELAMGLRNERLEPFDLRLSQPEKVGHETCPIWECESRGKRSIKQVYGS